jgi:hypothetical protein
MAILGGGSFLGAARLVFPVSLSCTLSACFSTLGTSRICLTALRRCVFVSLSRHPDSFTCRILLSVDTAFEHSLRALRFTGLVLWQRFRQLNTSGLTRSLQPTPGSTSDLP